MSNVYKFLYGNCNSLHALNSGRLRCKMWKGLYENESNE